MLLFVLKEVADTTLRTCVCTEDSLAKENIEKLVNVLERAIKNEEKELESVQVMRH